jgi:Spy/CpxP family protein refolding chaperone
MKSKTLLIIILTISMNLAQGQRPQRLSPDQRAQQMQDSLVLSDAQKDKLVILFTNSRDKMMNLRDSLSAINEEVRPALIQVRREEQEAMKKFLTTEQWNKWKAIRERQRSNSRKGPRREK